MAAVRVAEAVQRFARVRREALAAHAGFAGSPVRAVAGGEEAQDAAALHAVLLAAWAHVRQVTEVRQGEVVAGHPEDAAAELLALREERDAQALSARFGPVSVQLERQ